MCIRVSENDHVLGPISKRNAHSMASIDGGLALHRAFSVFLFVRTEHGTKLLLQQRATSKITFAN